MLNHINLIMIRIYTESPAWMLTMAEGLRDNARPSSKLKNVYIYGLAQFACIKNMEDWIKRDDHKLKQE